MKVIVSDTVHFVEATGVFKGKKKILDIPEGVSGILFVYKTLAEAKKAEGAGLTLSVKHETKNTSNG